jgi:hypothetical protein
VIVFTACRLFTHGYDFYAPTTAVVYHLWQRSYRPVFQEVVHPKRQELQRASVDRVKRLLGISCERIEVMRYGLGSLRSLTDFEAIAGIRLSTAIVLDGAYDAKYVSGEITFASVTSSQNVADFFAESFGNSNTAAASSNSQKPTISHRDLSRMLQHVSKFL